MKNKRNVIEDESVSRKKLKDIGTPGDDNKVDTPGDENKVEKGDDDVVPTNSEEAKSIHRCHLKKTDKDWEWGVVYGPTNKVVKVITSGEQLYDSIDSWK